MSLAVEIHAVLSYEKHERDRYAQRTRNQNPCLTQSWCVVHVNCRRTATWVGTMKPMRKECTSYLRHEYQTCRMSIDGERISSPYEQRGGNDEVGGAECPQCDESSARGSTDGGDHLSRSTKSCELKCHKQE